MGEINSLNFQLRLEGQRAIKKALTKLSALAEGQQRTSSESETYGIGSASSKSWAADDLEAAKALAKFGIDAIKLAKAGSLKEEGPDRQKDLFDSALDPWDLKKVE